MVRPPGATLTGGLYGTWAAGTAGSWLTRVCIRGLTCVNSGGWRVARLA